jgi:radical SAM/Cys-rich protein
MTIAFDAVLAHHGLELRRTAPRVLQLNLGRVCNLTCAHCHVSAGPTRTETMSSDVATRCIAWIERHRPEVVDLTGGAPELCAQFRRIVVAARATGARVMVRTNLTVLCEPAHADLGEFFRAHRVHVVASMPCYLVDNVDAQRGDGVHAQSIAALRLLNALGYGRGDGLVLDLVYNPGGATLPPNEKALEADYKRVLGTEYGIVFDALYCLANIPVGRFASRLRSAGDLDGYVSRLSDGFNPATVAALMCRDTISVGWTGEVHDCDFHQMQRIPLGGGQRRSLWEIEPRALDGMPIATASHCFACTAGSGSSCGGALVGA